MKKKLLAFICFVTSLAGFTQDSTNGATATQSSVNRPRLVVGIVADQMRWDYLYRYQDLYASDGGFNRLLAQGYSCQNTFVPYAPTITACGHASIFTGSVPAINGITGNDWWDYDLNKTVYCTEDNNEQTTGSPTTLGQMSPRNLLTTTIGDELKLATNFKSKVIGVAIKDRGAILPAGHSSDGAFWYDNKTGDWISSTYYAKDLPGWVKKFNRQKLADKYYSEGWDLLLPLNSYDQSESGGRPFPKVLKQYAGKNYDVIAAIPQGNSMTFEMAMAAVNGERLGKDTIADMLTISLSTPDYIGHAYGPNSVEAEDNFLKLDKDLGNFLNFLDEKVGKGQYLFFLTADHGAAHTPSFLTEHKIPAGHFESEKLTDELNAMLQKNTGVSEIVIAIANYQVYLNYDSIQKTGITKDDICKKIVTYLAKQPGIDRAFNLNDLENVTLNERQKTVFANGYYPKRSGDVQLILQPQWIDEFLQGGTTHGVWNPYDSHIPLIWYGWQIKQGETNREVYMTDIAATVCALLHIQEPDGCIGKVIKEVINTPGSF